MDQLFNVSTKADRRVEARGVNLYTEGTFLNECGKSAYSRIEVGDTITVNVSQVLKEDYQEMTVIQKFKNFLLVQGKNYKTVVTIADIITQDNIMTNT